MSGTMSIGGLVSGLETEDIISKIMEYARRPQTQLENQKTNYQQSLLAWQDINTRVLAVKTKLESIADASDFKLASASSSSSSILTAYASNTAATGTYYVNVVSRAQNHQVSSQASAYSSVNDIVGTGDVSITLENGTNFEVTLDTSNNTLSGLKDAINKANNGVQATIINSGTSADPDYRLFLNSTQAGLSNQMTVLDTSGLTGGVAPVFDLDNPVQAAAPAQLELGQGTGKITVTKDSNTIADLIPGVTLNLLSESAGTTVRVDITRDTTSISQAIQDFVAQYNDLADAIDQQFVYDTETQSTLALFGDSRLRSVQSDLISALTSPVDGLTGDLKALGSLGITQDTSGYLTVDSTQLDNALKNNPEQVARVFSAGIDSGSSYISYLSSTGDTKPSGSIGWQVEITQAARRAQVTAGTEMAGALTQDETLSINGKSVQLTSGMTIDEVIDRINSHTSETGATAMKTGADGTGDGNYITFRKTMFGSKQTVSVSSSLSYTLGGTSGIGNVSATSESAETAVGESGLGQGMAGLDVAGKINGEQASGNGQMLTLSETNSTNAANGLSLLVTAPESMGSVRVRYTKGAAAALREMISAMTSTNGSITTAESSLNDAITEVDGNIADMESRLTAQEARLYAQFNAMETQLAKLQDQGNYLTQQLAAMNSS